MKNIRETCIEFLQNEDIKKDVKAIIRPIVGIIYNEVYPYLWFLCIYNVFLIFIVLANLVRFQCSYKNEFTPIRLNYLTKIFRHHKHMENIYEPNSKFNFDQIKFISPTAMAGGNHMIKLLVKDLPLYIQPPKCKTKNGIFKAGKRHYSDLIFSHENEEFIQWLEELEKCICKSIYANREKWFEVDMELHDIENYFTPPMKVYKSGKFYIVRANAPSGLAQTTLTIYNESEEKVDPESINENSDVITILEVQGIKCLIILREPRSSESTKLIPHFPL